MSCEHGALSMPPIQISEDRVAVDLVSVVLVRSVI
jgi:hypothetical protein